MKTKANWILVTVAVLSLFGWTAFGQLQESGGQSAGRVWEYRVVPVLSIEAGQEVLQRMGKGGWELAAVQPMRGVRISPAERDFRPGEEASAFYFFKRAK